METENKRSRKIGIGVFLIIGLFLLISGAGSIPLLILAIIVAIVNIWWQTREGNSTDSYGNPR